MYVRGHIGAQHAGRHACRVLAQRIYDVCASDGRALAGWRRPNPTTWQQPA